MLIGKDKRTLTKTEEDVINYVFNEFKKAFILTEIKEKGDIIGIGEPDKHLFCYFTYKDGLKVKFKTEEESLNAFSNLSIAINNTIKLFKTDNSLILNNKNNSVEDTKRIKDVEENKVLVLEKNDNNLMEEFGILTKEENLFFKILLNNVDSNTGELLSISKESIDILKNIYNKCLNFTSVTPKEIKLNPIEKEIVEDYISGNSLQSLSAKYELSQRKIKRILKKAGVASKQFYISSTYKDTLDKIEQNKGRENVGARWTNLEDNQLVEEYKSGVSVVEIAKIHKRKVGGIRARLVKHGFAKNRREVKNVYDSKNISLN